MAEDTKAAPAPRRGTTPAPAKYQAPHEVIMSYVAYRRAQIQATLGPPGINRGGAAAIQAQSAMNFLVELEAFAEWLSAGQPGAKLVLTEGDRQFWSSARDRGLPVPEEILERL